ncbi:MAG TPA: DUF4124 domain-containing protein, partial [Methylotenera sp.]|nr:DUF4124 domain-containing protein [Methylotenera sp.]
MPKSIDRTQTLAFTLSAIAIAVTSSAAQAEVYKWRDARGVVQYSDKPPASGFTKASQSEIVNALQKKELCSTDSTGTKTKNSKEAKDLSAFITTFGTAGGATPGIASIGASTAPATVATTAAPKPVTVAATVTPKPATLATAPVTVATTAAPKPASVATAPAPTSSFGWGSLTKLSGLGK